MVIFKHLTYLRISNIPTAFVEGTNDRSSEYSVATCPIKSNRLVDDAGGRQPYLPVACLGWSTAEAEWGISMK